MPRAASTRSTKLLLASLVLVTVAVVCSTAATTFVAGDGARRVDEDRFGYSKAPYWGDAKADADRFHNYRQVGTARALIDSAVAMLGESTELDSTSLRRMVSVASAGTIRNLDVWIDGADTALSSDTSGLALYRRWARARRLPNFWGYRPGFASASSAYSIPIRTMQPLLRLVEKNEAIGDALLASGDARAATERALENIGAARQLLDQPMPIDMAVGRVFLQHGARQLVRIAVQTGDTATHALAGRLDTLAKTTYLANGNESRRLLMLDTETLNARANAIAGDTALHPAIRLMAVYAVIDGACVRPGEVLTGASAQRRATLEQLLVAVRDIPRAGELAPLFRRSLDQFDAPSAELLTLAVGVDATERAVGSLSALAPRAVRHRVAYCRMLM